MFSIYQSMGQRREADVIEHDRFCQCSERMSRSSTKKYRRRGVTRRAQSASELNPRALADARKQVVSRTVSTDIDEKTPLLNKFLSCMVLSSKSNPNLASKSRSNTSLHSSPVSTPTQTLARHGGRYEYTALEADSSVHERLELERKARERAQSACLHYLRTCPRYTLLHHLNDIGSRVDKHWFVVRDTSVKTERLLTLVPRSANCPIQCNPSTRNTILELFLALQHPYIYPVLDLEFRESTGQSYVILVLPFNSKGSLKDLIYKSRWQDDWSQKYGQRSEGLPVSQVQRLGRQILEALLFLKERGFPPCSHLHSGNVILQNGVARLTGLENTLLGHTSRIHPVIWSRARTDPQAVDTICFGHVLFEMCAGYELCAPQPSAGHLMDIQDYPQVVEVLDLIFHHPDRRFPTVEELLLLDFFRNIDLREMRATPLPQVFRARLTTSTMSLLSDIRKHQNGRRTRRSQSASTTEAPSPPPRERRNSVGSSDWGQQEADDSASDRQPSPTQEHRDLSLHLQDDSTLSMETRCLLR